jgi:hypothetical protein
MKKTMKRSGLQKVFINNNTTEAGRLQYQKLEIVMKKD